jgi:hypothetical protein
MPISIDELERTYRRAYRRLSIGIGIVYGVVVLTGLAAAVGNTRIAGRISPGVQAESVNRNVTSVSEPMQLAQPAKRIRTVKYD